MIHFLPDQSSFCRRLKPQVSKHWKRSQEIGFRGWKRPPGLFLVRESWVLPLINQFLFHLPLQSDRNGGRDSNSGPSFRPRWDVDSTSQPVLITKDFRHCDRTWLAWMTTSLEPPEKEFFQVFVLWIKSSTRTATHWLDFDSQYWGSIKGTSN